VIRLGPPLVLLAALLASSPAAGQSNNPLIEAGQTQYDELRFEEALQTLSAALVRAGNTRQQQATIYQLLAFTYLALGRQEEAAGAYRSLLALDPAFQPGSDVSPRVREFFDEVRQAWETDGRPGLPAPAPVNIQHRSPAQADRGEEIELVAELEDPSQRVASMVLAYRQGNEEVFQRVDMTARPDGGWVATIPGDDVAPPLVEYYFEALNETGLPVAARGDVAAPLRVAVPEEGSSIFAQWWFWVGAAVLIGGAVTAGVLLAGGGDGQEQGTFVITVR
jgi:tetratricopeptide (TPR) repeat protein